MRITEATARALRFADERHVEDYRIYIDLAPLAAASSAPGGTPR